MSRTVLIIDRDTQDIQRVSDHLKQYGFKVFVATRAQGGIEMFFEEYPDLILLNLLMPDMPGVEIAMTIKGRKEGMDTPLVLMAQLASSGGDLFKKLGAQAQISKPVDLIELDNTLQSLFDDLGAPGNLSGVDKDTETRSPAKPAKKKGIRKKQSFIKVLANIYKDKSSGILTVEGKSSTTKIKFSNGQPSAFLPGNFAKFLVKQGHLKTKEAKRIPKIAKKDGLNSQQALSRLGAFSEDKIESLFKAFIYDLSGNLAELEGGNVFFDEKSTPGDPVADTVEMIWQAVRRIYDMNRLEAIFNKGDRFNKPLYPIFPAGGSKNLVPQLNTILAEFNQAKSLTYMMGNSSIKSSLELLQIVYSFLLCGLMSFNAEDASRQPIAPQATPSTEEKKGPEKEPAPELEDKKEVEPAKTPVETEIDFPEPEKVPEPIETPDKKPKRKQKIEAKPPAEPSRQPEPDIRNIEVNEKSSGPLPISSELSDKELMDAAQKQMDQGAYSKAQACYEELVDRGADKPEVLVNLGLAIYHNRFIANPSEKMLDVAWLIKKALAMDPKYVPAYLTFGRILERDNKIEMAQAQYKMALAEDPKNPKATAALRRLKR